MTSADDKFESPNTEEAEEDELGDTDTPTSSGPGRGMAAIKEHICKDMTTFAMFCSRMIQIIAALAYLLPIIFPARTAYVTALLAALVTSLLRLRQRLPAPQLTRQWGAAVVLEDASHYVMYALVFVVPPPLTLVLLPVTAFAVLHSSSYTLQILDLLGAGSVPPLRYLVSLVEVQSQTMLRAIAITEVVLLPYTVIMLLAGHGSLLVPFVYYRFLTLRYASRRNPYSRATFSEMHASLETQAANPRCPALLAAAVRRVLALASALGPPMVPAQ